MEVLGLLGRNVADADADIAVAYLSVLNESVDRRDHDLGGNGESHAGKTAGLREQERVDADDLATHIHQRATGVARIDGRVRLDEFAWCPAVFGEGIGRFSALMMPRVTVKRKPSGLPNASTVWPGCSLVESPKRHIRQIASVNLDDRKIGKRVGSDEFCREDSPVGPW